MWIVNRESMPIDYIDIIMRDTYLQDIEEIGALMQDINKWKIILLWDSTGRSAKVKKVSTHVLAVITNTDKLNVEKSLPWTRSERAGKAFRPFQAIQTYQYIEAIFLWERWWGDKLECFLIIFLLPSKNEIWMLEANVNLSSSYT